MSDEQLKTGDVVTLKSGGPDMTVRWVEDRDAYCDWFLGGKHEGAKFSVSQLKHV